MKLKKNFYTVHKFGGSSLADAERFRAVKQILTGKKEVIVVSATKGTTSTLQRALDLAQTNVDYLSTLATLEDSHVHLIKELIRNKVAINKLIKIINKDFEFIRNVLATVSQIKSYVKEIQDFVLGFGEIWSARILSTYLSLDNEVEFLDASTILYSYLNSDMVCIDWEKSQIELDEFLANKEFNQLIVTGFISKNYEGRRTILGRNGSDYSGAIFAKLFKAKCLYIWTDVDGIYSAHPQKVKSAFVISDLSYKEAHELAYFGASVLYPMTIAPVESENIPLYIKNSFNPNAPGTYISNEPKMTPFLIKGLTYISDIALINVDGAGLIGVADTSAQVFQVLKNMNVPVLLISQASSEYSLCFAVSEKVVSIVTKTLQQHFKPELISGQIGKISSSSSCAIIAAVGDEMIGAVGAAGKLCATLAKANINIKALAQGSSERNISVVINNRDVNKALQALHAGFYLSNRTLSVGLIGPGIVGRVLLEQISAGLKHLQDKYQVNLCVRGIMGSKTMLLADDAIDLKNWKNEFQSKGVTASLKEFTRHIMSNDVPHSVIIDCTASEPVSRRYLDFVKMGINVVTPNKHANGGSTLAYYKELQQAVSSNHCQYLYEATVCAGLPVINTIQDLIKTGDEVTAIEGVVSGTLSYIFSELARGRNFSEVVLEAKKLGYTEPDPREDLSGKDVGRKLICLAREIGYNISLDEIEIVNLVPKELQNCSVEEFLKKLPSCDKKMAQMVDAASKKQEKLRYVACIKKDKTLKVAIESFPDKHPFNRLDGTDNMLIIHTKRYCGNHPMIIQGPGAGAEVTAAGIFADLLRLASSFS